MRNRNMSNTYRIILSKNHGIKPKMSTRRSIKNGYTSKVNKETKHSNNSNLVSSIQASKLTKTQTEN